MAARKRKKKKQKSWAEQAAQYAWASVIFALIVPMFLTCTGVGTPDPNNPNDADDLMRLFPGIMYLLLTFSGIAAGIAALCAIGKFGKRRIMAPAITGLVLHVLLAGLLVLALIPALRAARQAAERIQEEQEQEAQDARDADEASSGLIDQSPADSLVYDSAKPNVFAA